MDSNDEPLARIWQESKALQRGHLLQACVQVWQKNSPNKPTSHREVTSLDAQYAFLLEAARNNADIPAGRLLGLPDLGPDDCWVDVAGAAAIAGVKPKTVTGWLSRGKPANVPFPSATLILNRLYWSRTSIEAWCTAYGPICTTSGPLKGRQVAPIGP
ncbi:hypothetical protein [Catellatospora sichuanensis]|uniref:hypothetical protein n=1 Tax=Catellatospora sichuanensis TaxID=1969805 RepID=UPI001182C521|nr:hypothetical protein [Catellatospora sichuanensis]